MEIRMIGKHVGFDIGHCETTATITRLNNGQPEVVQANVDGRNTVVLSQIRLTNEQMNMLKGNLRPDRALLERLGKISIGEIYDYNDKEGETFSYFKVSPDHFDDVCAKTDAGRAAGITHGQVMACLIYTVMENTLTGNALSKSDLNQLTLYIGCPTTEKWTGAKPSRQYAELAKRATGAKSVLIIPESRAALYSSLEKKSYKALSAEKGVIVFDFGSSTADCTFMRLGVGKMEYSWDLGAHSIEDNMAKLVMEGIFRENGMFDLTDQSMKNLINECRKFKEIYFKNGPSNMTANVRDTDGNRHFCEVRIDKDFMRRAIEEQQIKVADHDNQIQFGTWSALCREFLSTAKTEMQRKRYEASSIVLTGGASRMPFIEELCKAVYGDNVQIYKEDNPSHTVSAGLGWLPVVEDNFDESVKAVEESIKADTSCGLEKLKTEIKNKIFEICCEEVPVVAKAWAEEPGDTLTCQDLTERLRLQMKSAEKEREIRQAVAALVNDWKNALGQKMCEEVNSQAEKLLSAQAAKHMMLDADVWKGLAAGNFAVDLDVSKIVEKLDTSTIGAKALGWIVGFIAGSAFGPFVAGFGAIIGEWIAGKLDSKDANKPLKQKRRKMIAGRIPGQLNNDNVRKEMLEEFDKSFKDFEEEYDAKIERMATGALSIVTLRTFGLQ